jgi:DNA-binding NtrC family response regulator
VLLSGAPDCGQEAVARLLLDLSSAPNRSFVQIAAAEAESRHAGAFGLSSLPADVFLFLPDVDQLSLAAAEGLLRLMRMRRSRTFTVVAATTQDLRALAAAASFPAELANALTAVRLELPCLKQRSEDLPMLLSHLVAIRDPETGRSSPKMAEDLFQVAMEYAWPGNLHELSCVASSLLESSTETRELTACDFNRVIENRQNFLPTEASAVRMVPLETVMQEHTSSVLRACRGNKLRAAEVLGISRSTLYRMLHAAAGHTTALVQ